MDGYGRWIALFIFIVVICLAIYNGWKKDKEEMKIVLMYLFISIIGLALISFIANFW
jgi:uncharacterized membrane protein